MKQRAHAWSALRALDRSPLEKEVLILHEYKKQSVDEAVKTLPERSIIKIDE